MDFIEVLTTSGQKVIINKYLIKTIKECDSLCFIETNDNLYVTDVSYDELRRQLFADEDDLK